MENHISKTGNHVYAKDGMEAVKIYREAINLEEAGKPWLDDEGVLIHQELRLNGELFMSITDEKHLDDAIKNDDMESVKPIMMNTLYFRSKGDLQRAYELLHKDGTRLQD